MRGRIKGERHGYSLTETRTKVSRGRHVWKAPADDPEGTDRWFATGQEHLTAFTHAHIHTHLNKYVTASWDGTWKQFTHFNTSTHIHTKSFSLCASFKHTHTKALSRTAAGRTRERKTVGWQIRSEMSAYDEKRRPLTYTLIVKTHQFHKRFTPCRKNNKRSRHSVFQWSTTVHSV